MTNSKKRGFTIIELVIVIAVIAILAGVLIPTFVSVIKKANVSSDTALVRNINEALAAEDVTDKPTTMYQALKVAREYGFSIEKLTPRSSGEIVWNSTSNRFALVEDGKVVYSANGEQIPNDATVWSIAHEEKDLSKTYSNYLAYEATGTITVTSGLDVGENKNVSVKYENTTGSKKTVVFNMNGGMLTVDAATDDVYRYGIADKVVITAVAPTSYHECGTVNGNIELTKGRVVLENDAVVEAIQIAASEGVEVKTENGAKLGFISAKEGVTIDSAKIDAGNVDIVTGSTGVYANGQNYSTIKAALAAVTNGTIVLLSDTTESDTILLNGGEDVVINLNGHKIATSGIDIAKAKVAIQGTGEIVNINKSRIFRLFGSTTDPNAKDYTVLTIGKGVTVQATNLYDVFVTSDDLSGKTSASHYGIRVTIYGKCIGDYGIYVNGQIRNVENAIAWTIEDSAQISGIYAAGYANWTINGGEFGTSARVKTQCEFAAGNIVINGGTFHGNDTKELRITTNESCSDGYALAVLSRPGYAKSTICQINGGNFDTEIAVVNQDANNNTTTILNVVAIGSNHGVVKSGANVSVPKGVTVLDYNG